MRSIVCFDAPSVCICITQLALQMHPVVYKQFLCDDASPVSICITHLALDLYALDCLYATHKSVYALRA